MANDRRVERLQKQILRTVSNKVLFDMQDPRTATSITFTRVKLARDMSVAKVYYSVLGTEGDKSTVAKFLSHARNRIREAVGDSLTTRSVPQLEFIFDPSIEGQIAMSQTLRELEEERQAAEAQRGGETDPNDDSVTPADTGGHVLLEPDVAAALGEKAATNAAAAAATAAAESAETSPEGGDDGEAGGDGETGGEGEAGDEGDSREPSAS